MSSLKYINKKGEYVKIPQYTMISDKKIRGQIDDFMKNDTSFVKNYEFSKKFDEHLPKSGLFQEVIQSSPKWKNVTEYGVANDGLTDVTEQLQALINESVAGDVLYFPIGTYLISSGLVINHKQLTLRGDNPCNWNYKYYNWSDRTKDKYVASVIKLADGISNVTMLTISGASTNSDVTLENLKFVSTSATWSEPEIETTDGTPHEVYNFTITNENVNGIYCDTKTLKNSQVSIINVSCSGFSGTACKLGNCGRTVGYVCLYSNVALETGVDNTIQYAYITMCNLGIKIGANCVFIYDTWIDLIRKYGIYSENYVSGNIVANLDHIGYAGIKVKSLNHMNVMARMNRCGGYYAGCSEDVITECDKACLIYAEYANNNVLNITCHALRNWSDNGEEGMMSSSPYGFCGTYWNNNNISIGTENKYGVYRQVSTDANYKIYRWRDNTFVVAGKTYVMNELGLLSSTYSQLPSSKSEVKLGKELTPKIIKGSFPTNVKFTFASAEKRYLSAFASDNAFLRSLDIEDTIINGSITIIKNADYTFKVTGKHSSSQYNYIYGAGESNEKDILLEKDMYFRKKSDSSTLKLIIVTSEGEITVGEEIIAIASGVTIYGIAVVSNAGTSYTGQVIAFNASDYISKLGVNITLSDGTTFSSIEGSVIELQNNKWVADGNELSIHCNNVLSDFVQELFNFEHPFISKYYSTIDTIIFEYNTNDIDSISFLIDIDEILQ